MSSPSSALSTVQFLATASDDMWYFSGDTAVDMSWYTKRATLAAVCATTELYWIQLASIKENVEKVTFKKEPTTETANSSKESSHSLENETAPIVPDEVIAFLDRRLGDVASFGRWRAGIENNSHAWINILKGILNPMKR